MNQPPSARKDFKAHFSTRTPATFARLLIKKKHMDAAFNEVSSLLPAAAVGEDEDGQVDCLVCCDELVAGRLSCSAFQRGNCHY